jgi:PleD family two-component response regulator
MLVGTRLSIEMAIGLASLDGKVGSAAELIASAEQALQTATSGSQRIVTSL